MQAQLLAHPQPPALPEGLAGCRAWQHWGSPRYQEQEQGDHMKQDKTHISNQAILDQLIKSMPISWHPQEMRISTTSPKLGQAVVGRGTNLYQDYPEGQCNYLDLNVAPEVAAMTHRPALPSHITLLQGTTLGPREVLLASALPQQEGISPTTSLHDHQPLSHLLR